MLEKNLGKFVDLELSLLAAVVYFDMFDFPLTIMELKRWLYQPEAQIPEPAVLWSEVHEAVSASPRLALFITSVDGYLCLRGREAIIGKRKIRYALSQKKYGAALWRMRFFKYVPFLRAVWITNTLSYNNVHRKSDIDIMVQCDLKRVWTVRWYLSGFSRIFRLRPEETKFSITPWCAHFFFDDPSAELGLVALRNRHHEIIDVHLAHLLGVACAVYDEKNYHQDLTVKNGWIKSFFRNEHGVVLVPDREVRINTFGKILKLALEMIHAPARVETVLKYIQLWIMPRVLKEKALQEGSDVVVTDGLLKFHSLDRRREYAKIFFSRFEEYGKTIHQMETEEEKISLWQNHSSKELHEYSR